MQEIWNYTSDNKRIHSYTPQQNKVAQQTNFDANLSKRYWAEAVNTAVYVINRPVNSMLKDDTPKAIWTKTKVDLRHVRIFGSKVMVHVPKERRRKWNSKSRTMLFMRYCDETKGIDPKSYHIVKSHIFLFIYFFTKKKLLSFLLTNRRQFAQ